MKKFIQTWHNSVKKSMLLTLLILPCYMCFLSLCIVLNFDSYQGIMNLLSFNRLLRRWIELDYVMNIGTHGPTLVLRDRFLNQAKPMSMVEMVKGFS